MKLIECYIENFGKLKNEKISFSEGLNSIKHDNGWGKTTLAAFIKVMLYGMSDTKRVSLDENDRKHYLPWDGSAARGTLTFETGGTRYRIERGFAAKPGDDTFTLYDVATGRVTVDYGENLGEELFGIDADGFERTVFLSERALTPKSENKSVSAKLSDLVGCDGDIGVMDDAMKALEERRKFYFKKGGSGELTSIKNRIADAARQLERITDAEKALDELEKTNKEQNQALKQLEAEKSALTKERERAALTEAKAELTKRYGELQAELASLTEKRRELLDFFGGTPPTFGEISANALKLTEADGIEKQANEKSASPEYTELKSYFDGKTDRDEIDSVKATVLSEKSRKALLSSQESLKLKNRFSKRIPSHSEIDELITLATRGAEKRKPSFKLPVLLTGATLTVIGVCLGLLVGILFFLPAVLGIAVTALAFIGKKQEPSRAEKFDEFYQSVSGVNAPSADDLITDLFSIKASIDKAQSLQNAENQRDAELFIRAFCTKFSTQFEDLLIFAEEITDKYSRYTALAIAEEYRLSERKKALAHAAELREAAHSFTAKYRTSTNSPFDELREKLNELDRVSKFISDKEFELARFAEQYGKSEEVSSSRPIQEIELNLADVEEKATAIRREITINDRARLEYSRVIEEKDDVAIKITELGELYEKHNENYNVILKTKEYLERAKDSMTAKYLGKTKAGFEKYTALIGGAADERFEMSTDFGVSKFEGASPKSTEAYSRGTRDLYNLAARLALIDSLYENESPFIILDDPFIAFDDKKTAEALKLIRKFADERQIIYLTCSGSREA